VAFEAFEGISEDKQQRVINAAIGEFAKRGYKMASTNEVIREAGISKGLLFHYFHSKKDMFLYVYDYSLAVVRDEMLEKLDFSDRDILNRFRQMAVLKIDIIKRYPPMYDFLLVANRDTLDEFAADLQTRNTEYVEDFHKRILHNVDTGKFKQDVDVTKAISLAFWTMEHFTNRQQDSWELRVTSTPDYEHLVQELDAYFAFLRALLYIE
jgi:TetR/AcrR family transcriptional regulator